MSRPLAPAYERYNGGRRPYGDRRGTGVDQEGPFRAPTAWSPHSTRCLQDAGPARYPNICVLTTRPTCLAADDSLALLAPWTNMAAVAMCVSAVRLAVDAGPDPAPKKGAPCH